jgi:hypothetical protein
VTGEPLAEHRFAGSVCYTIHPYPNSRTRAANELHELVIFISIEPYWGILLVHSETKITRGMTLAIILLRKQFRDSSSVPTQNF